MLALICKLCLDPSRQRLWRALFLVLVIAITYLALVPDPPRGISTGWDKSNHALAFASLAFVAVWAFWQALSQWPRLVAALLAYGGAIEIAQSYLPPRSGEWFDLLADAVGIAIGLLGAAAVKAIAARQYSPPAR